MLDISIDWETSVNQASNTAEPYSQKRSFSCCVQCWCSLTLNVACSSGLHNVKKDVKVLENVQRRAAKLEKELGCLSCEHRLRTLGLLLLE